MVFSLAGVTCPLWGSGLMFVQSRVAFGVHLPFFAYLRIALRSVALLATVP